MEEHASHKASDLIGSSDVPFLIGVHRFFKLCLFECVALLYDIELNGFASAMESNPTKYGHNYLSQNMSVGPSVAPTVSANMDRHITKRDCHCQHHLTDRSVQL